MLYANPDEYSAMAQTEFAQSLNRQASAQGIKVLALDYNFGMRNVVMARNQLRSVADLQGVIIRVPRAQLWIDTFTLLGAAPVGMVWAELYNALQTGVVNAYESSLSDTLENSLFEVARYITTTAHFVGTGAAMMSQQVWDSLSAEHQQIIQEEFTKGAKRNNELSAQNEAEAQAQLEAAGMVINEIDLTEFRQRARAWFDNNRNLTPGVYDTIANELNRIRGN
jgi:TRAP-type C4-dicarboxylate transport system substrate-binding protein